MPQKNQKRDKRVRRKKEAARKKRSRDEVGKTNPPVLSPLIATPILPNPGSTSPVPFRQITPRQAMPLVSIIMLVKDGGTFMLQAAQSVKAQTYDNYEFLIFVVSDDQNKWDTTKQNADMLARQDPGKCKVHVLDANQSRGWNYKRALLDANGDYICTLDHPDLLSPHAVARMVQVMQANPNKGMAYSKRMEIKEDLAQIGVSTVTDKPYSRFNMLTGFLTSPLRMFRRQVLQQVINNWEPPPWAVDYDLCLRISEQTEVIFVPEVLYHHRQWGGSLKRLNYLEYYLDFKRVCEEALKRRELDETGYSIRMFADEIGISLHKQNFRSNALWQSCPTRDTWNKYWSKQDSLTPDQRRKFTRLVTSIQKVVDRDTHLLDVGCGDGRLIGKLKGGNLQGIDFSAEAIKKCGCRNQGKFICKDAYDYLRNAPGGTYDVIVMQDFLQYSRISQLFMFEVVRNLREGGRLFVYLSGEEDPPDVSFWKDVDELKSWLETFLTPIDSPTEMMLPEPISFPQWLGADRGPARTDPQLGAQNDACGIIMEYAKKPEDDAISDTPVTILIPSYNRANLLKQNLYLTGLQTHRNTRFHVYDDGSTDNTAQVIEEMKTRISIPIQYHRTEHIGIAKMYPIEYGGTTDLFVCQVDSDDYIAPRCLELCLKAFNEIGDPNVGVIFTDYVIINSAHLLEHIGDRSRIPYDRESLLDFFMSFQFRLVRTAAYQKMDKADFPMPGAGCGPDYDLCIRLSEVCDMKFRPHPLYYYRQHEGSINSTAKQDQKQSSAIFLTAAQKRRAARDAALIPQR